MVAIGWCSKASLDSRLRRIGPASRYLFVALWLILCLFNSPAGTAEDQQALCDRGNGSFDARMSTGVRVVVNAPHTGAFAARTCSASFDWKDQNFVVVPGTAQVDIDVMGADLGLGEPVVAFQTRQADNDWRATYSIYSLKGAPLLLRTIEGGDFYRAADTDFDGNVEIWTSDAAAVNGFDGLTYSDFDFPPTVVLRFEHGRLMDVSAEFPARYDQQIAQVGAQLNPQALDQFKNSDGKLLDGSLPWPQLIPLRKTKAKVLDIVWSYLYSGRQQEAWAALAADWPTADLERARAAILDARDKGIDAQVKDIAGPARGHHHGHPIIYNTPGTVTGSHSAAEVPPVDLNKPVDMDTLNSLVDQLPRPIEMTRQKLAQSVETVELVIDSAGKVWSAKVVGSATDPELLEAAKNWKFIPAFKGGRAVACRDRIDVNPER